MALYHHFTKPEGSDTVIPITRQVASQLATPPDGVDRSLWLYELCRFLTMKVNNLIIAFFAENPPCSAQTCPEMRASEWQYLCAVHDPPKSCCAIDYCCHTLDWATNTLTSPKYFPSRLTLGAEGSGGPQASMRHLTNIFRRLYRIFAHAWFQHRDVFWTVEGHDGLYVFFKTVCDMFALIPEDNYTIPQEAEGPDAVQPTADEAVDNKRLTILRKEGDDPFGSSAEGMDPAISTGATTRRHKHSPSTGSRVSTITESAEDNDDSPQLAAPLREALQEEDQPEPTGNVLTEETKEVSLESTEPILAAETAEDDIPAAVTSTETEKPTEEVATEEKPKEAETDAQDSHDEANPPKSADEAPVDDVTTSSTAEDNKEVEPESNAEPATEQKSES